LDDGAFGSYLDGDGLPVYGQRDGSEMVPIPGPWLGADKVGLSDGTVSQAITGVSPQQKGADGDGSTNDYAALVAAVGTGKKVVARSGIFAIGTKFALTDNTEIDLSGATIKQLDGANLSTIAEINVSNAAGNEKWEGKLYVDGNRANNATTAATVIGTHIKKIKKGTGSFRGGANDCAIGGLISGEVEYAKLDLSYEGCDIALQIAPDADTPTTTPDELMIDLTAHAGDTFLNVPAGSNKMTGLVRFACEVCQGYAINILGALQMQFSGIVRGVGQSAGGGGIYCDNSLAYLSGELDVYGGSSTNCDYVLNMLAGELHGFRLRGVAQYKSGAILHGGVLGSMQFNLVTTPNAGHGLQLGVASETQLNGVEILPGSALSGPSGYDALLVANAINCTVDLQRVVGRITIGSASASNTIKIPKRSSTLVTFVNNRTQLDNTIIFKGAYTLTELNALNGSAPFKGMRAEHCRTFNGAPAYYNGNLWVPSHGILASGTATLLSANTTVSVAHGLGYDPGNIELTICPDSTSNWLTCTSAKFAGNVTTTNVVIAVNAAPGADVLFNWQLRAID
jgi:hypothetical protein